MLVAMEQKYDLTLPFLAIRNECAPERREKAYFEMTYSVYLINPTDTALNDVKSLPGGYMPSEDGPLVTTSKQESFGSVPPKTSIRIGRNSQDEFDEIVCYWDITFDVDRRTVSTHYSVGRMLREATALDEVPVLGGPALIAARGGP